MVPRHQGQLNTDLLHVYMCMYMYVHVYTCAIHGNTCA